MKSIFFKELRENAKWAFLLFLALAGATACALNSAGTQTYSLVSEQMFTLTTVAFPVVGLALGLLQVLQDSSAGRWGFVTHRPISLTRIFFAKLLAGLCLYVLITGVPLEAAAYWVCTPGNIAAPFDWHMVLPRLADLIGGSMWYAAGLLIAARRARWIGSRLFPGCVAFFGSAFAGFFPMNFGESLLIFAACLILLLPAAWGAFVNGGGFERQSLFTRIVTALAVGVGAACALGAAAGITTGLLQSLGASSAVRQFTYYQIANDGTILKVTADIGQKITRAVDLQDHPVPSALTKVVRVDDISINLLDLNPARMPWQIRRSVWGLQRKDSNLIEVGSVGEVNWYYVVPRRTIEGFDIIRHTYIGSIGPNGFIPPTQTPQPFPEMLYTLGQPPPFSGALVLAAGETAAYSIDLQHQSIETVFVTDSTDPIINTAVMFNHVDATVPRELFPRSPYIPVIVTQVAIHVLENGKERIRLPLTHTSPDTMRVEARKLPDGRFALTYQTYNSPMPVWGWAEITDSKGNVVSDKELPLLPRAEWHEKWWVQTPELLIYPPVAVALRIGLVRKSSGGIFNVHEVIASSAILVTAAFATFWLSRRMCLSRLAKAGWMAFNALIGFSGVLLLVSLFQRIATVPCPSCGKRRLVSRERCERCNAPFNFPATEGIEIFE